MLVLGVTGGVGMGKSTVAELLRARGLPVIDTDLLAREETEPGAESLADIRAEFGSGVIDARGRLDRAALAAIVFSSEDRRKALERILHPRIRARWRNAVKEWRAEGKQQAVVVVIPLLFETGAEAEMDRTICVACTPGTQIERLRVRGWTAAEAQRRIAAQWPVSRKMDLSDAVIWTESTLAVCEMQAARVFGTEGVATAEDRTGEQMRTVE